MPFMVNHNTTTVSGQVPWSIKMTDSVGKQLKTVHIPNSCFPLSYVTSEHYIKGSRAKPTVAHAVFFSPDYL